MKKYLGIILIASILGVSAAFVLGKGNSSSATSFQANVIQQTCFRTNDTHIVQCNFDAGSNCGELEKIDNTRYLYQLPEDKLNESYCLSDFVQGDDSEVFWTKSVNSQLVTTNASAIAQVPEITSAIFPTDDCSETDTPYICVDADDILSTKAYWVDGDEQHFLVNRGTKYYEYVYDGGANKWLYTVAKDEFFDDSLPDGLYVKFPLTRIPIAFVSTAFAEGAPPVVDVQFGKILPDGTVEQQFITIRSVVHTITAYDTDGYTVKVEISSGDLSEANVWRLTYSDIAGVSSSVVSGWIPARAAEISQSNIVEFDDSLRLRPDQDTSDWISDFFSKHTQQLYNVVTQEIENPLALDPNIQVEGAFYEGDTILVKMGNETLSTQKAYYILENSGVAPNVPECSGEERIFVSNEVSATRTNNLLTGDTGYFTVVGGSVDQATSVLWEVSNAEESRIENAADFATFSSTSIPFEIQAHEVGSTELAASSVITAVTQGDVSCSISTTINFEEGLRIGVEQVDVMVQ